MAKNIASLSSDDQAALTAALSTMGYLRPIGTPLVVSSPTPHLDFDLPTDCNGFMIQGWDVQFSAVAALGATFSFDGGSTFVNDNDNGDSYGIIFSQQSTGDGNGATLTGTGTLNYDAIAYFAANSANRVDFKADISPGSNTTSPRVSSRFWGFDATGGGIYLVGENTTFLNPAATVVPSYARCNAIRLVPTASANIIGGTIALFGIKVS